MPGATTRLDGGADWETRSCTHLLRLARALLNPRLRLVPGLVEREETGLSAALDQLIRLRYELRVEDPTGELGVGRDRVCCGVP